MKISQQEIADIVQKIAEIGQLYINHELLCQNQTNEQLPHAQTYLDILQHIEQQFEKCRQLEEEYLKLEDLLQRQQMEMRKRVSIEEQLKLHAQTLQLQIEALEKQKMELLFNSKNIIKDLKKTNQSLFSQLQVQQSKDQHKISKKHQTPLKLQKQKSDRSYSHNKPKPDRSLRQIIRTEYIERDKQIINKKSRAKPAKNCFDLNLFNAEKITLQNETAHLKKANTAGKKEKPISSKSNKMMFSNLTLLNVLQAKNKKTKRKEQTSIAKAAVKRENNSKAEVKDKGNRSIYSACEVQIKPQKSTL